jgi:hypothetical protein
MGIVTKRVFSVPFALSIIFGIDFFVSFLVTPAVLFFLVAAP